jgi:hypothetical protein
MTQKKGVAEEPAKMACAEQESHIQYHADRLQGAANVRVPGTDQPESYQIVDGGAERQERDIEQAEGCAENRIDEKDGR